MGISPLDISVVVRTYTEKRWDYLGAALESVQRQNTPPLELVVVVDHNPTLLGRVKVRFPDAVVVDNQEPPGSSGAWNSGIQAASGQVIAFLDDDAEAAPDWLEQLGAAYTSETMLGVGGLIRPNWLAGARPRWFPEEFDWVVGCSYRGLPEGIAPVRNLIGCNMSLRRLVFEGVGGFRKNMGHVGGRPLGDDETELCIRVRQNWPEGQLLHNPRAVVDHKVPASRAGWGYFYVRCRFEGLSKALMARIVGATQGLESERAYTLRTLPRGVARGIGDALLRGDLAGLARAWAIFSGLAVTAVSYCEGMLRQRLAHQPERHDITHIAPKPPRAGS